MPYDNILHICDTLYHIQIFQPNFKNEKLIKARYRQHNAYVMVSYLKLLKKLSNFS